jgi:hypothetical protein
MALANSAMTPSPVKLMTPATVFYNDRQYSGLNGSEFSDRALFIGGHHHAIANHIGSENRC